MHELHAAFASYAVFDFVSKTDRHVYLKDLAALHSHFAVDTDLSVDNSKADPLFLVADNLISRGLPSLAPIDLERKLTELCCLTHCVVDRHTGSIKYKFNKDNDTPAFYNRLAQAFCLPYWGTPILEREEDGTFESPEYGKGESGDGEVIEAERHFIEEVLPVGLKRLGYYLAALAERQIPFDVFSKQKSKNDGIGRQSVDFLFSFYGQQDFKGLIVEIDGAQHNDAQQKDLDEKRDHYTKSNNWLTVRLPTSLSDHDKTKRLDKILTPVWKKAQDSFGAGTSSHIHSFIGIAEKPFFKNGTLVDNNDNRILDLVYLPIAVARICKVLTRLLCTGRLTLNSPEWNLTIVERDIACADTSIAVFKSLMSNLFACEGSGRALPNIKHRVISAKKGQSLDLGNTDGVGEPDAVLDFSIITKFDVSLPPVKLNNSQPIRIRSVYRPSEPRRLLFSPRPAAYHGLDNRANMLLKPFLRDVFRKVSFRPKQVNIITRTLRGDGTVALLPTGSGKSLTYQLSALLQPGCVLIVAPIKSLMRDQRRSLLSIGVDTALFINSSLSTNEREQAQANFADGGAMFAFISPERLVIQEFREYLRKMQTLGLTFSFVVIDEAHCVSEWGHDFRTAYLRLGENARAHAPSQRSVLPLLALTGTASYDVLTDVQGELGFAQEDDSCLIYPDKSERPELHYEVFEADYDPDPKDPEYITVKKIGEAKIHQLINLLNGLPTKINALYKESPVQLCTIGDYLSEETENAGIIFCPYKSDKQPLSTVNVAESLRTAYPELAEEGRIGFFNGTDIAAAAFNMEKVQDNFMNGSLSLLAATKAFGMGIDKPSIRFTVHANIPQSIEAFAQEAGRAGRDRRPAVCSVMFCAAKVDGDNNTPVSADKSIMLSFHNSSFPGLARDRLILFDLLDTIKFPKPTNASRLNSLIKDELDLEVNIRPWSKEKAKRIYINYLVSDSEEDKSYIGVFNANLTTEPDKMAIDEILAVKELILREIPKDFDPLTWLSMPSDKEEVAVADGLETSLVPLLEGEDHYIVIGVENNVAEEVADYIRTNGIHPDITDVNVKKLAEFIKPDKPDLLSYGKAFVKKLESKKGIIFKNLTDLHKQAIQDKIIHLRTEKDTYKAVYRLRCVGAIQDYTILYRGSLSQIYARIRKLPATDYIAAIKNHVGRYVSKQESELIPEYILERKQSSILRNCLDYLLDFTYRHIAEKRRVAIDNMESAVMDGIGDTVAFAEQINTYFDSKYLPLLRPHVLADDENIIWEFLEKVKGRPDEAKHLRGACKRLMESYPENGLLKILLSYANLVLTGTSGVSSSAVSDLYNGFNLFEPQNVERRKGLIGQFIEELAKHNEDSADAVSVECVNAHFEWLKVFNDLYSKGVYYGNQRA